jgi:hypothetical protein
VDPLLEPLAPDLWVARRPLPLAVGDVGARMTVMRESGNLLLHSPVAHEPELERALRALGEPRWLVAPNKVHHLFLGDWVKACPEAEPCAAPGLPEKRRDLSFRHVLGAEPPPGWPASVKLEPIEGAPQMNEIAFLHAPSRTLVLTDLVFNVTKDGRNRARLFHRLVGATGRFGPHRLVRTFVRDRAALRRSLDRILAWDFDRVVMSHGEVLERDGRRRLAEAFAYLE